MYKVKLLNTATTIKQGDTIQQFEAQILKEDGTPVNLTNATIKFRLASRKGVRVEKNVFATSPTEGKVSFKFTQDDNTGYGNLNGSLHVKYATDEFSAPTVGFISFNVQQNITELGSESVTNDLYTMVVNSVNSIEGKYNEILENGVDPVVKQQVEEQGSKIDVLSESVAISVETVKRLAPEIDDNGRVQRLVDSIESGSIIFPYGKTYELRNVTRVGKSIAVFGVGAKIIQKEDKSVFSFSGAWEGLSSVQSISVSSYGFDSGTGYPTTKITLPSSHSYKVGDLVKVISDDLIYGAKPGDGVKEARRGEMARVGGVDGLDIYLTAPLRNSFVTNVRLAKMANVSFIIEGITFECGSGSENWTSSMITIRSSQNSQLRNLNCKKGYGQFITMLGCYGGDISWGSVGNLANDPSKVQYGYGVNLVGCDSVDVRGVEFFNTRSGITTDIGSVTINDSAIERYGVTTNCKGLYCKAHGVSGAGFSSHPASYNMKYIQCNSVGSYRGKVSSGSGFVVRGIKTQLINCEADNCRYGFYIYDEVAGGSKDISVENCKSFNSGHYGLQVDIENNSPGVDGLTVIGGSYESVNGTDVILINKGKKVRLENVELVMKQPNTFSRAFYIRGGAEVEMENIVLNLRELTASNPRLFRVYEDSKLIAKNIKLKNGTTSPTIIEGDNSLSKAEILEFNSDKSLSNVSNNISDYRFQSTNDNVISQQTIMQTLSADEAIPQIQNSAHDRIYLNGQANTTGWGFGVFPAGYKRNQMLIIRNTHSSNTLVVRSSSSRKTELKGGQSVILNPKESILLFWNGSLWMNAS